MNWKTLTTTILLLTSQNLLGARTIPQITNNRQEIVITQGTKTFRLLANQIKVTLLDTLDCAIARRVPRQVKRGTHFNQVAINPTTGEIAIGVHIQYCYLIDESAVLLLKPTSNGQYQSQILSVPKKSVPKNGQTYPLLSIDSLKFQGNNLLVTHASPADGKAQLTFNKNRKYVNCIDFNKEQDQLCPNK